MRGRHYIWGYKKQVGFALHHSQLGFLIRDDDELELLYLRMYMLRDIMIEIWEPEVILEIKRRYKRLKKRGILKGLNKYPFEPQDLTIIPELKYRQSYH